MRTILEYKPGREARQQRIFPGAGGRRASTGDCLPGISGENRFVTPVRRGKAIRDLRHGVSPRLGMGLCCAILLLLLPALLPDPCHAADITLSSRTYLLSYERAIPGGGDRNFAPLYEYLSGDASNLGGKPLSFHFYGWGRHDLGDDTDDDGRGGDLASAYVQYVHPAGNAEMRLGRFFFTEGNAAGTPGGRFLKAG